MNTTRSPRISRLWLLVPAVAALLAIGIVPRLKADAHVREVASGNAEPLVRVVSPTPAATTRELLLPGSMQPWAEAAIRARSSGYVTAWHNDIGARVLANALLATLVAPELDAQVKQARDAEATARANLAIAQTSAQRWQQMLSTKSISQQETDQKLADLQARQSELSAAQANVARVAQLLAYTRVVAPFAGMITARNVDVGTLVDAGAPGEMFHIARTDRLRVFVAVPDDAADAVIAGGAAEVIAGGRTVAATVARSSGVLDPGTHTMRVEVDVDNAAGTLLPGAFVQVRLALPGPPASHELPVETLLFRPDGPTVAIVGADGTIVLKTVRIQRDLGTRVEIAGGLSGTEKIVINPGDAIVAGQRVRIAPAPAPAPTPAKA